MQVSSVDRDLTDLRREREDNLKLLNTRRVNHIATLHHLGKHFNGLFGIKLGIFLTKNFYSRVKNFLDLLTQIFQDRVGCFFFMYRVSHNHYGQS